MPDAVVPLTSETQLQVALVEHALQSVKVAQPVEGVLASALEAGQYLLKGLDP